MSKDDDTARRSLHGRVHQTLGVGTFAVPPEGFHPSRRHKCFESRTLFAFGLDRSDKVLDVIV